MRFRTMIFLASLGVATAGLVVAGGTTIRTLRHHVRQSAEASLRAQARLAGRLLETNASATAAELSGVTRELGRRLDARVTVIDRNGRVIGDSVLAPEDVHTLDNHGTRPEVVASRHADVGIAWRYSQTFGRDMLYVAVPVRHAIASTLRLSLPSAEAREISRSCAARPFWPTSAPTKSASWGQTLDETVRMLGGRVEDLAKYRGRLDAMLAGMVEGVMVVDPEGRIEVANAAVRTILRLETASLDGHYLELVRQPDVIRAMTLALGGTPTETGPISLAHEPTRMVEARAAPVAVASGGGAILVLHDITEIDRTDRIRRDFLANVSHELRTPLTAIRGCIEALQDGPLGGEEAKRFLEIISRHSARMERLVRDLLRLTRLDAGQEPPSIVPCSVASILADVVLELTPALDLRRQRIEIHVARDVTTVAADPVKLHDLLRNLLDNAIAYSPPEGVITLEADRLDDAIRLTVADQGPGMPPAELTRVFERFYRIERSRARDPGGTGLGLAIVKHLVELQGGKVRAENRPESGALFTVVLPEPAAP